MSEQSVTSPLDAMIELATQLHSPPEVAQSLLNLTRDEDFDVREIVDCIQRDPAMAVKVLQVVNSSRYGLRTAVTNLHQAVALLGQRTVRLIAMTFSIVETFTSGPAKALYNDFWRGALTMASGASRIARHTSGLDRNDVYTAGLLADVGSLVIAQADGERYLALYRERRGEALATAERNVYGFDHAAVASRLLEQWEFPVPTLEAIRDHHCDDNPALLATATRGAALLHDALWLSDGSGVPACRRWLERHFSIDIDAFTDLALQCRDEVLLEMEVYGVNQAEPIDSQALLEQARRQYIDSSLSAAMDLDSFESAIRGS